MAYKIKFDDYFRQIIRNALKYKLRHLAPSLSCARILFVVYSKMKKNDRFILSKGHAYLALATMLEMRGKHPKFSEHPDIDTENGVEITAGSLGHGLAIAVGMAKAKQIKKEKGRIFCLCGDGEFQEGIIWEALGLTEGLDNLKILVDYNRQSVLQKVCLVNTVKGRGLPFMEGKLEWHARVINEADVQKYIA